MYWQENEATETRKRSAAVVDIAFRISCPALPVDHAWSLSRAVQERLNWFSSDPHAGIHPLLVAESNNGWNRPPADGRIHLSKRVRLVLRIPVDKLAQAAVLEGHSMNVSGECIKLNDYSIRDVKPNPTLFSRHIATGHDETEEEFLQTIYAYFTRNRISVPKLLPGRKNFVSTPDGMLCTRSLLLAELSDRDSLKVQELGYGKHKLLGCGLFVHYKSIGPVPVSSSESALSVAD